MASKSGTAKLFRHDGSQAVRLPKDFQFSGDRVRVRREESGGVLLEPLLEAEDWFSAMDQFAGEPFMADGGNQPPTPRRDLFK